MNAITAWLFSSGRKGDLNIRAAFLHMAADAAVSLAVVIAGLLIIYTGWTWLDPLASLGIVAVIVWGTWGLLRESAAMALDAVPQRIDRDAVAAHLASLPGVTSVHDLHIWGVSTTETALTVHVVRSSGKLDDRFLAAVRHDLQERFSIDHTAIQLEEGDPAYPCELAPAEAL